MEVALEREFLNLYESFLMNCSRASDCFSIKSGNVMAMFGNVIEMSGNVCYDMGNGDYDENH